MFFLLKNELNCSLTIKILQRILNIFFCFFSFVFFHFSERSISFVHRSFFTKNLVCSQKFRSFKKLCSSLHLTSVIPAREDHHLKFKRIKLNPYFCTKYGQARTANSKSLTFIQKISNLTGTVSVISIYKGTVESFV